jgi:hypothetical protein
VPSAAAFLRVETALSTSGFTAEGEACARRASLQAEIEIRGGGRRQAAASGLDHLHPNQLIVAASECAVALLYLGRLAVEPVREAARCCGRRVAQMDAIIAVE